MWFDVRTPSRDKEARCVVICRSACQGSCFAHRIFLLNTLSPFVRAAELASW